MIRISLIAILLTIASSISAQSLFAQIHSSPIDSSRNQALSLNDSLPELKAEEIDPECNNAFRGKSPVQVVVNSLDDMKALVRDMSLERCLRSLDSVDFDRYTLLGVEFHSGHCRRPPELAWRVVRDDDNRRYLFIVDYGAEGRCRAWNAYQLWVLVPKLPEGYEVVARVEGRENEW